MAWQNGHPSFAYPYCKAQMAEAIKFLEPSKKHHVCVAPFACAEVLGVYKKKVHDLNIQNAFYKQLGLDCDFKIALNI